tara:strand:- start:151 stop:654 length:504 start_codon:yes stop_codon:yes gene_type:complete
MTNLEENHCTGAGIVIFYDNRGIKQEYIKGLKKDVLYLFLEGLDGKYDFPKGQIDHGEYCLTCAIRETSEEISLEEKDYFILDREGKDFISEKINKKGEKHVLRMYIAELKKDSLGEASLKMNPKTEIIEHNSFVFAPKNAYENKLLDYLIPVINWSDNIVLNYLEG